MHVGVRVVRPVGLVRARSALRAGAAAALVVAVCAGCSLLDRDEEVDQVSVFDVAVGDCFRAPEDIEQELTELSRVDCAEPHEQELYALAVYDDEGATDFPGAEALKAFADGRCAQEFEDYVGVDYRDSTLFFTYLVPSPRSWDRDADRTTLCFITTTGEQLTASVAGSEW